MLLLDTLELSTAPWALGQVLKGNIDNIRFDDFGNESERLRHKLQSLEKLASNLKQSAKLSQALTTFEIIEILKILGDWAGFEPTHQDAAVIVKLNPLSGDCSQPPQNTCITDEGILRLQQLSNELVVNEEIGGEIEGEDILDAELDDTAIIDDEPKVSILNSFFLRDLERTRDLIRAEKLEKTSPVLECLSSIGKRHPDLLVLKGVISLVNLVQAQACRSSIRRASSVAVAKEPLID